MVKELDRRARNKRKERNVVILGCEGRNNRTEELYFTSLEKKNKKYHFIFACGKTDPISIVKNTINKAKASNININDGDLAFSVFDVDLDKTKVNNINLARSMAKKSKYKVEVITSNPCFEVWYLQHFINSTKPFNSSDETVNELNKYIVNYRKSNCYETLLLPRTEYAIENSRKLNYYNEKFSIERNPDYYNPNTNVYEIVEQIVKQ